MKCTRGEDCGQNEVAQGESTEEFNWDGDNGRGEHEEDGSKIKQVVDLNEEKTQEKLVNLILYGAPPADKKGHSDHLQFKIAPYHTDIMESVRGLAPRGHWRTQSEYLRCAFSVGNFIMMKFLKDSDHIDQIDKLFELYDMIEIIAKRQRQESLKNEFSRALSVVTEHEQDVQNMVGILNTKLNLQK